MESEDEISKAIKEITERKQKLEKQKARDASSPQQKKKPYRSIFSPQSDSDSDSDSQDESPSPNKYEQCASAETTPNHKSGGNSETKETDRESLKSEDSTDAKDGTASETSSKDITPEWSPGKQKAMSEIAAEIGKQLAGGVLDKGTDDVQFYMGPYGMIKSPFKKTSSLQLCSRGVKRSPR